MNFVKKYLVFILCLALVISLSALSIYNYKSQKNLFLSQLHGDTESIVQSVKSSINKFSAIKKKINLQRLIQNISLKLDIFEFRYLDKDGIVLNSMFKEEIGKKLKRTNFNPDNKGSIGRFYEENRDMTNVLAISYPVSREDRILGFIDLAVDISSFDYASRETKEVSMQRMETDIGNLLNAIASSIIDSLLISENIDFYDFLSNFTKSAKNVVEIGILNPDGTIAVSSVEEKNKKRTETGFKKPQSGFIKIQGKDIYQVIANLEDRNLRGQLLMLRMDASPFMENVNNLFVTALGTTLMTILFTVGLVVAYSIYGAKVQRANEEKGSLEQMVAERTKKIASIMESVKGIAENVVSESRQLSSIEKITNGIADQINRANNIAISSLEMSQTISEIAKKTSSIADSATYTSEIAENGANVVGQTVTEVQKIEQKVNESSKLMSLLEDRSSQIGEIVDVINDIADQTDMLAINAAIEAARAGDQGRGFAVVADEVRKLAEKTAKATLEIRKMIKAIQNDSRKTLSSMEESLKLVKTGVGFSNCAGESLQMIVNSVNELKMMVDQVASSTDAMSSVSENISLDIETIASVSQETSKISSQVSSSYSTLTSLSTDIQKIIDKA